MDAAEAVVADPGDPDAKAILGRVMLDLGRYAEAVACLTESAKIVPTNVGYRESLALALERVGNEDMALRVLVDGIVIRPSDVSLRNAAILLCVRRRDFSEAVRLAEKACSAGVADASTFGMKGHALSSLGYDDDAGAAYSAALNLAPEDPYLRHLAKSHGSMPGSNRAPAGFVSAVFDEYADRFELHLAALEYSLPGAIRSLLKSLEVASRSPSGSVLDLGCGTGMVASALAGLGSGPLTGIDLSQQMLRHARAKQLYAELRHGDIVNELTTCRQKWPLIIAADVFCYFGALDQLLALISRRLPAHGLFVFSVEIMQFDHDGAARGNGHWALQRQGRYSHSENYVNEAVRTAGLRVIRAERLTIRREAGGAVPGLLLAAEPIGHDN
jgi:predicted TPR repeat methyltransferase